MCGGGIDGVIRKAFDASSNGWLEPQWLRFGTVFMLAAAAGVVAASVIAMELILLPIMPRRGYDRPCGHRCHCRAGRTRACLRQAPVELQPDQRIEAGP